jgi:glycosyltransferase involved in cell wall biosynthesis
MDKPYISLVIPAYNEEAIIYQCLHTIVDYVKTLTKYNWEIIVVNDGSKDKTGELADQVASENNLVKVVHHFVNRNLGGALRTGFEHANGDYIVTYDLDLSYAPVHIGMLVDEIIATRADVVLASPYMKGGKVTNVPFLRLLLSKWANRFMNFTSRKKISTYSCMVRVYRTAFIKTLNLKSTNYAINPEIIFKAQILRARILEIPAHLDWSFQNKVKKARISGIKIKEGILDGFMSGFIFRPYYLFFLIGLTFFLSFFYMFILLITDTISMFKELIANTNLSDDRFAHAFAEEFRERPHAFLSTGFVFVVACIFIGLGLLSLQNKRYFDELFHINTSILRNTKTPGNDKSGQN